jgi:hypothetical protein
VPEPEQAGVDPRPHQVEHVLHAGLPVSAEPSQVGPPDHHRSAQPQRLHDIPATPASLTVVVKLPVINRSTLIKNLEMLNLLEPPAVDSGIQVKHDKTLMLKEAGSLERLPGLTLNLGTGRELLISGVHVHLVFP